MIPKYLKYYVLFLFLGITGQALCLILDARLPVRHHGEWRVYMPYYKLYSETLPYDSVGLTIQTQYNVVQENGKLGVANFYFAEDSSIQHNLHIPTVFDSIAFYDYYTIGQQGNAWQILSLQNAKVHPQQYQMVHVKEKLALTKSNGKMGWWFSGIEMVKPKFNFAIPLGENMIVGDEYGKLGLMNLNGKLLIPFEYDFFNLNNGFDEKEIVATKNGQNTLFIKESQEQCKKLKHSENRNAFFVNETFYRAYEGDNSFLCKVENDSIIFPQYNHAYLPKYQDFFVVSDGVGVGVVQPGKPSPTISLQYDFVEVADSQRFVVRKNGKYGVIDHNEKVIIPLKYDRINSYLSGDKAMFMLIKDRKIGLADWEGKVIVPVELEKLKYVNGLFLCRDNQDSLLVYGEGGKLLVKSYAETFLYVKNAAIILLEDNQTPLVLLRDTLIHKGKLDEIDFSNAYLKITQNSTVYYHYLTPHFTIDESFIYKKIGQVSVAMSNKADTFDIELNTSAGPAVQFVEDQKTALTGAYSYTKGKWILAPKYYVIKQYQNDFYTGVYEGKRLNQELYGNFNANLLVDVIYNFTTIDKNITNLNYRNSFGRERTISIRNSQSRCNATYKDSRNRYKFNLPEKSSGAFLDFIYPAYTPNHDLIVNNPILEISEKGKRSLYAVFMDFNDMGIQYPKDAATLEMLMDFNKRLEIVSGDVRSSKIFEFGSGMSYVSKNIQPKWKNDFFVLPNGIPQKYPYRHYMGSSNIVSIANDKFIPKEYEQQWDNGTIQGEQISFRHNLKYQLYDKASKRYSGVFDEIEYIGASRYIAKNKARRPDEFICGVLNEKGDTIIPVKYQSIQPTSTGYIVEYNYDFGVLDKNGNKFIPIEFKSVEWVNSQYICNVSGRRYSIFEAKGDTVLPLDLRIINRTEKQSFLAKKGGEFYVFNKHNECLYKGTEELEWLMNDSLAAKEEWWGVKVYNFKREKMEHRFIGGEIDKVKFPIEGICIRRKNRTDVFKSSLSQPEIQLRKGFDEYGFGVEMTDDKMYLVQYTKPDFRFQILRPTYSVMNDHILFNIMNGATIALDVNSFNQIPLDNYQNMVFAHKDFNLVYDRTEEKYLLYKDAILKDSIAGKFIHRSNDYFVFEDSLQHHFVYNLKSLRIEYLKVTDQLVMNNEASLIKYGQESFFINRSIVNPYFNGSISFAGDNFYQWTTHQGGIGYFTFNRINPDNDKNPLYRIKYVVLPSI